MRLVSSSETTHPVVVKLDELVSAGAKKKKGWHQSLLRDNAPVQDKPRAVGVVVDDLDLAGGCEGLLQLEVVDGLALAGAFEDDADGSLRGRSVRARASAEQSTSVANKQCQWLKCSAPGSCRDRTPC
jgi:hypothetical protein